ncbi:hypothetical protein Tco_0675750, partial [Tanacetum coccineum]
HYRGSTSSYFCKTIDGHEKVITEDSLRRHLKLDDAKGISLLSNEEIFEHLVHMGSKKTAWDQFSSNIATAIICLVTTRRFKFSKFIFEAIVKNLDSPHKFLLYPRFIQLLLNKQQRLLLPHTRTYPTPTLTSKLFSNMRRASKGYSGVVTPLFESMLVQAHDEEQHQLPLRITSTPSLSQQPTPSSPSPELIQPTHEAEETASMPHDSPLHDVHSHGSAEGSQTKKTYSTALTKLVLKVKKLEYKLKSGKARRKENIVLSDDEEIAEDSSKQGRKISQIDKDLTISQIDEDPMISLVQDEVLLVLIEKKAVGIRRKTLARRRASDKQGQDNSKRQKKEKETADYEEEKDELRMWLTVVLDEEEFVDSKILHTKFPIVDWESQSLGNMHVYKIIRAYGNTSYHKTFESMLKSFNRHDLEVLHRLVMERFQDNTLEGYNLMLWGDMKILVDPEQDDDI